MRATVFRISALSAVIAAVSVAHAEVTQLQPVQIIGEQTDAAAVSGSAHVVDTEDMERNEYTDIHRVLRQVPGVYFQEEDGFGLRPNIGIRGSGSERSSKISLMEDGVLIAPAPYSDPAAYYFPVTARMSGVEVLKGPDTLRYGPFTVGGAVNLLSTPIPAQASGQVTAEVGENGEQRMHVRYGASEGQWGFLLETHQHEADGFKNIDRTDAPTGFDKGDYVLKLRWMAPADASIQQQVDLKLQRDSEVSDETYLGLTDTDFRQDANRRYALSEFDQMETEHESVVLRHSLFFDNDASLTTTLYRNDFMRDWFKTDRVNGTSISNLVGQANAGNAGAIGILDGSVDVVNVDVKHNNREYLAEGVQMEYATFASLFGEHEIIVGARYHSDEVDRFQPVERFDQVNGRLSYQTTIQPGAGDNRLGEADAMSAWLVDHMQLNDQWRVTGSLRYEDIETAETRWTDLGRNVVNRKIENDQDAWLVGLGTTYALDDNWSLLAGVHQGFAPAGAGAVDGTDPEESLNYEAGFRFRGENLGAEAIAFYSDYSNTVQNCSIAAPCPSGATIGTESFGESRVKGLELSADTLLWQSGDLGMPARLAYTWTDAEISENADDLSVLRGDLIPYLPEHLLSVSLGLEHTAGWSAFVSGSYTDDMCIDNTCDRAGVDDTFLRTDSYVVFDAVASYRLTPDVEVYAKVDNLLDDQEIIARSPAGARPNKPRTGYAGIKVNF